MNDFGIKISYEGRIIAKKKAKTIEDLKPILEDLRKKFKN